MLEKLCNLASDDLLNVVCRSRLSLISLRAVVEGDQHLVSTSPPPPSLHPPLFELIFGILRYVVQMLGCSSHIYFLL